MTRFIAVPAPSSKVSTDVLILSLAVLVAHGAWFFADVYSPQNDYLLHYLWAGQFAEAISQGSWRPAWAADSRGGLGDPVFVYYVPLFYYLTAAAERVTGDMWGAVKLVCALAALLTGSVVTAFARLRGVPAAWARGLGVLAILLPVTVVVRGTINAYPWFAAHLFLVLVLIALLRCIERPSAGRIALLALAVATLCWTHTLLAASILLTASVALLADWALIDRSRAGFGRGLAIAAAFVLGLALSAPAMVPAIGALNLVTPSGWDHANPDLPAWFNTFSFPLFTAVDRGIYAWLMPWGSFVLLAAFVWLVRRSRPLEPGPRAMAWVVALSAVLCTELSYPLWDQVHGMRFFQRPFRFLSPMTMALLIGAVPLLAASLASRVPALTERREAVRGCVVALVALAPLPLLLVDQFGDRHRLAERAALIEPASADRFFAVPEHLPAMAGPGWRAWLDAGGFAAECAARGALCEDEPRDAHHAGWRIRAADPVRLRLPLMGYPAWVLAIDDRPLPAGTPLIDRATGLLVIDLPPGTHRVAAAWTPLREQRAGDWIGLAALAAWGTLSAWAASGRARSPRALAGPA